MHILYLTVILIYACLTYQNHQILKIQNQLTGYGFKINLKKMRGMKLNSILLDNPTKKYEN